MKHPVKEAGASFLGLAAEVGVSTMLIFTGPPIFGSMIEMDVSLARMVMPRSRSRLKESITRSAAGWLSIDVAAFGRAIMDFRA